MALRDQNVVSSFYSSSRHEGQEVFNIFLIGIVVICNALFVVVPTRRHGIGYPIVTGQREVRVPREKQVLPLSRIITLILITSIFKL